MIKMKILFLYFNSIKVRLERSYGEQIKNRFGLFQFHKGTIRTRYQKENGFVNPFQFHKGTIRTLLQHLARDKFRDFNSIKVRLEL